jgi:uncharacterized spore protein YtfJ
MDISPAKQLLDSLSETLSQYAAIKKVYGEPIETQGKTIIPVARLALGFGGGFGEKKRKNKAAELPGNGDGEGGGFGGGLRFQPLGVLEVTPGRTRFLRFHTWRYLALGTALGWAVGWALRRVGRRSRFKQ